jgi:hypothetical protein
MLDGFVITSRVEDMHDADDLATDLQDADDLATDLRDN